jgi:hypothetical protein
MNLTKSFVSNLGQYMRKVAHHSGGMDSSNPHCWRGKGLHHHGGGVCWLFCVVVDGLVVKNGAKIKLR